MKTLIRKYGNFLKVIALAMVTYSVNTACLCYAHQPEIPHEAKKLRKF